MIGLLDYDAIMRQKVKYPNLELMKMATYLRRNRQSYRMVIDLENLDIFTRIIVFQNDPSVGYPGRILRRKDTEWYGLAFTSGVYQPMAPEIEECEPYIGTYKLLFKEFLLRDTMTTSEIGYLLNASYLRLSMSLNKRYIRTIKPNRRVLVYDTDAFQGNWEDNVNALIKRDIAGFIFLYEQKFYDIDLWAKVLLNYERRVFNYNPMTLYFNFDKTKIDTIINVYLKAIGDNKTRAAGWFDIYPMIPPPYKENTIAFAESIRKQMDAGIALGWKIPDYKGNPFHPFVNAICEWAGSNTYFFRYTFLEYVLKKDLHKERKFALKLIQQNKKFRFIFEHKAQEIAAMVGGLKSYESRRNYRSLFGDYL